MFSRGKAITLLSSQIFFLNPYNLIPKQVKIKQYNIGVKTIGSQIRWSSSLNFPFYLLSYYPRAINFYKPQLCHLQNGGKV